MNTGILPDHENYRFLRADTTRAGDWTDALEDVDAVVNLAGKTIFKRWTRRHKQEMVDSRVLTTRRIVEALPQGGRVTLVSASAVGYYGNGGEGMLPETAPNGTDFLARLSRDWESEAVSAEEKGARVVVARFGIVLGKGGGALSKMIPAFKSFAGGPIGDGRQWFPWIHVDDLTAAIAFFIREPEIRGPVNCCAPNPVRNRTLAETLGKVLGRPALVATPAFMIRLSLGEMGSALLASQRMIPERLDGKRFSLCLSDPRRRPSGHRARVNRCPS